MTFSTIAILAAGGLVPSLIWLYFLLQEDARCPEPRIMILAAFFVGMLGIPIVLPLEQFALAHLSPHGTVTPTVITAWAMIEEVVKYLLAAALILWRPVVDEPLDYVMYMITVALGFAALENAMFLDAPLLSGHLFTSAITENVRFLGSTLLHMTASATIGFALAFSYNKRPLMRMAYAALGVILAIALHATFNLLIMNTQGGAHVFQALFLVWTGAVIVFALFEVLKYRTYRNLSANVCP